MRKGAQIFERERKRTIESDFEGGAGRFLVYTASL